MFLFLSVAAYFSWCFWHNSSVDIGVLFEATNIKFVEVQPEWTRCHCWNNKRKMFKSMILTVFLLWLHTDNFLHKTVCHWNSLIEKVLIVVKKCNLNTIIENLFFKRTLHTIRFFLISSWTARNCQYRNVFFII